MLTQINRENYNLIPIYSILYFFMVTTIASAFSREFHWTCYLNAFHSMHKICVFCFKLQFTSSGKVQYKVQICSDFCVFCFFAMFSLRWRSHHFLRKITSDSAQFVHCSCFISFLSKWPYLASLIKSKCKSHEFNGIEYSFDRNNKLTQTPEKKNKRNEFWFQNRMILIRWMHKSHHERPKKKWSHKFQQNVWDSQRQETNERYLWKMRR